MILCSLMAGRLLVFFLYGGHSLLLFVAELVDGRLVRAALLIEFFFYGGHGLIEFSFFDSDGRCHLAVDLLDSLLVRAAVLIELVWYRIRFCLVLAA
jgi:hypothetical protein